MYCLYLKWHDFIFLPWKKIARTHTQNKNKHQTQTNKKQLKPLSAMRLLLFFIYFLIIYLCMYLYFVRCLYYLPRERDVASWEGRSLMVRWVVGSIPHGGPIELFLVPASAPQLVYQMLWYVLSCLWDLAEWSFTICLT